jgi:SAM-dependent methyltransferase
MTSKARLPRLLAEDHEHRLAFEKIYACHEWGGGSGPGSHPRSTQLYRRLLQRILVECHVRRVVDFGCGDWRFSRLVNWSNVRYLGVDVVATVIESDRALYSTDNIEFKCADFRSGPIPGADLYILKDVLQHWPTRQIQDFLNRMADKQMLITNTVWHGGFPVNGDIPAGEYRPLDLLAEPFNLCSARVLLEYFATPLDYKRVLLVNSNACQPQPKPGPQDRESSQTSLLNNRVGH